jgi:two-component system, NarL family, response regulator LiaR
MMADKPIRVMIVDDHAVVRTGLSAFIRSYDDMELAGGARTGEEAVSLCTQVRPDVVLMDLVMPGMDGATATQAIRQNSPCTQVVVLTTFKDDGLVQKALGAGAIGYLLKDVQADELAEAIRLAHAGQSTLCREATQALMHAASQPPQPDYALSDRELDVLALMVKGLNNTEIAERLVVSLSTVKHHVSHILSKLGAINRAEAVVLAVQNHLVE